MERWMWMGVLVAISVFGIAGLVDEEGPDIPPSSEEVGRDTLELVFVRIPPGSFEMGSDDHEQEERPVHAVTISRTFDLGKYEVTQRQWTMVMDTEPWKGKQYAEMGAQLPAVYISWDDTQAFLSRLNAADRQYRYRLPSEAEWAYSARGGRDTHYAGTSRPDSLCLYGNVADASAKKAFPGWTATNCNDGYALASPVGQFRPNGLGLHDMTGNVWEWVQDREGPYQPGSTVDPKGPDLGPTRVLRGNSFDAYASTDPSEDVARLSNRFFVFPDERSVLFGFRIVRESE